MGKNFFASKSSCDHSAPVSFPFWPFLMCGVCYPNPGAALDARKKKVTRRSYTSIHIVRATSKYPVFPSTNEHFFSGVMNLVPTTKYTPETSTSSRTWCLFLFFWVFLDSIRPIYPKMILSKCGRYYFNKPFLRAAFESRCDSGGLIFSDSQNRDRVVTGSFEFCQSHPYD